MFIQFHNQYSIPCIISWSKNNPDKVILSHNRSAILKIYKILKLHLFLHLTI